MNSESPKTFSTSLKAGILGFIGSFILSKILNPALESIWSKLLDTGVILINSISDSIYQEISCGFCEQREMLILYILTLVSCSAFYLCMTHAHTLYVSRKKELDRIIQPTSTENSDSTAQTSPVNSDDVEKTLHEIEELLNQAESSADQLSAKIKAIAARRKTELKHSYWLLNALLIFAMIFFLFVYGKEVYVNNAITRTTNNIEIVAPYISDQQFKQLKSDFHLIKSKSDYDSLLATLNEIADQNSLELKK